MNTDIVKVFTEKDAVTEVAELTLTEQVCDVPEQAPDQPENSEPMLETALRVTDVPSLNTVPAGLLVTAPCPLPVFLTVKGYWVGAPAWVTENACPATAMSAVRDAVPGFADREKAIVPLPEVLLVESIVTQVALGDAVQRQLSWVVTDILPEPPRGENDWLPGDIE